MPGPKKKFIDNNTLVSADFLNSIFGGIDGYQSDSTNPYAHGHLHDGRDDQFGHAPKIDLTSHITGRLTLPTAELKSMKFTAFSGTPLTSSLFWVIPVPADAYASSQGMYLNIFWSANGSVSPGNAAFRIDWEYLQVGNNVMPPSIIGRGSAAWPANTAAVNNPVPTTFRFQASASASRLYVNDGSGGLINLTLPTNLPGATINQFSLLGVEITSAPTVTLNSPMTDINIYAIELLYYSTTLGVLNSAPTLVVNNTGLADF